MQLSLAASATFAALGGIGALVKHLNGRSSHSFDSADLDQRLEAHKQRAEFWLRRHGSGSSVESHKRKTTEEELNFLAAEPRIICFRTKNGELLHAAATAGAPGHMLAVGEPECGARYP